jgi:hypothetical protein
MPNFTDSSAATRACPQAGFSYAINKLTERARLGQDQRYPRASPFAIGLEQPATSPPKVRVADYTPRTSQVAVWTVKSARDTVEGQLILIESAQIYIQANSGKL